MTRSWNEATRRIKSAAQRGLRAGVDRVVSYGSEALIRQRLAVYGRVDDFRLNSQAKKIHLTILLAGDDKPLSVDILRYEVVLGAQPSFVVREVVATRPWLDRLLGDFLVGRRIPIPARYVGMCRFLLGHGDVENGLGAED